MFHPGFDFAGSQFRVFRLRNVSVDRYDLSGRSSLVPPLTLCSAVMRINSASVLKAVVAQLSVFTH